MTTIRAKFALPQKNASTFPCYGIIPIIRATSLQIYPHCYEYVRARHALSLSLLSVGRRHATSWQALSLSCGWIPAKGTAHYMVPHLVAPSSNACLRQCTLPIQYVLRNEAPHEKCIPFACTCAEMEKDTSDSEKLGLV